jgi:hypothetical protein
MAKVVEGWVVYKNVPYNKGLHRFIEKQVTKWLRVNASEEMSGGESWYRVIFEREGELKLVACRIELRVRDRVWIGLETAHSADLALLKSLQRMTFVANPLHHPAWAQRRIPFSKTG